MKLARLVPVLAVSGMILTACGTTTSNNTPTPATVPTLAAAKKPAAPKSARPSNAPVQLAPAAPAADAPAPSAAND